MHKYNEIGYAIQFPNKSYAALKYKVAEISFIEAATIKDIFITKYNNGIIKQYLERADKSLGLKIVSISIKVESNE